MTTEITLYDAEQARKRSRLKFGPLFWIAIVSYSLIAAAVYMYLHRAPVYPSQFSLVLPGGGSSSKVTLNDVE